MAFRAKLRERDKTGEDTFEVTIDAEPRHGDVIEHQDGATRLRVDHFTKFPTSRPIIDVRRLHGETPLADNMRWHFPKGQGPGRL